MDAQMGKLAEENIEFDVLSDFTPVVIKKPRLGGSSLFKRFFRNILGGSLTFKNEQLILEYFRASGEGSDVFPKLLDRGDDKTVILRVFPGVEANIYYDKDVEEYLSSLMRAFVSIRSIRFTHRQPVLFRVIQTGLFRVAFYVKNIPKDCLSYNEKVVVMFSYLWLSLRSAPAILSQKPFFSHNDFYANNILKSENGITVIDWEDAVYGRLNPFFDIVDVAFDPFNLIIDIDVFYLLKRKDPVVVLLNSNDIKNLVRSALIKNVLRVINSYRFDNNLMAKEFLQKNLISRSGWHRFYSINSLEDWA